MKVAGVSYEIDWRQFSKGKSIFIPCLDARAARKEVLEVTRRLKYRVLIRTEVNEAVRGLRIWRI